MTLRELIHHRATTQTDLAAALGVSQAMVSKWVRGERNPKYETALRLADALSAEPVPPEKPDGEWQYRPVVRRVFKMDNLDDLQYYSRMAYDMLKEGGITYLTTNETLHSMNNFFHTHKDASVVIRKDAVIMQAPE